MIVGLNARLLLPRKMEGIGWYTHELFRRIVQNHPEHRFVMMFDRKWDPRFIYGPNVTPVSAGPQARRHALYYMWYNLSLPRMLRKYRCDVLVSLNGFIPLKSPVPTVNVFHDMGYIHVPEQIEPITRAYYRWMFAACARASTRLATISEFSRKDISGNCHIPIGDISIVPNGVRDIFRPLGESERQQVRDRFCRGLPFFLFVGVLQPRKNVVNLLRAFARFKAETGSTTCLLVAGRRGWRDDAIGKTFEALPCKDDIIFTGYLEDEDLARVMAAATALTFVPFFEGFGVPVVEAMASGTPVLTSNVSSLPEVAGDAALMVDPHDVEAMVDGMRRLDGDAGLRASLRTAGLARAPMYSWDRAAERLWELIEEAAATSVRR